MKNAIIFDVDGTLWDSSSRIAEAYVVTMKRLGLKNKVVTKETVENFMGLVTEDIAAIIFPEFPFDQQMKYIETCMDYECEYLKEHPGILYDDVLEVIESLSKKYDLFIVSNCQDGYIESLFSAYPLQQFIKDYECSGRTGLKKGDNIRLIIERNHISNAVYVGDTQKDKEACEDAGIPFIFASYGFGSVNTYNECIHCFKDLLNLFNLT